MADNRGGGDFLAGFVFGGMVGAALALLFAPQRGEETRAQLRERGLELRGHADEFYESAQERGRSAVGRLPTPRRERSWRNSTRTEARRRGRPSPIRWSGTDQQPGSKERRSMGVGACLSSRMNPVMEQGNG